MFRKPLSNFLVFISKGPCVSVFKTCMSKAKIPPCRLTCPCRRCMARSTSRALGMLSPVCRRWSSGPRVLCVVNMPQVQSRDPLCLRFFLLFLLSAQTFAGRFFVHTFQHWKSSPPPSQLRQFLLFPVTCQGNRSWANTEPL